MSVCKTLPTKWRFPKIPEDFQQGFHRPWFPKFPSVWKISRNFPENFQEFSGKFPKLPVGKIPIPITAVEVYDSTGKVLVETDKIVIFQVSLCYDFSGLWYHREGSSWDRLDCDFTIKLMFSPFRFMILPVGFQFDCSGLWFHRKGSSWDRLDCDFPGK